MKLTSSERTRLPAVLVLLLALPFADAGGQTDARPFSAELNEESVRQVLKSVADWQIAHTDSVAHHPLDWTNGALYAGMMAWAQAAEDDRYAGWLEQIGDRYGWQPSSRMRHADDLCVSQMYLDLYRLRKQEEILAPTKARLDWVIANPSAATLLLDYGDPETLDRWSWCDALFMAPPVYVKMAMISGDGKYLDYMFREYLATYEFLYDKEEQLFYRDHRYFHQREANGRKVFWGRGNGWVLAGLASMLKELPEANRYRPFFVTLFQQMARKAASVQDSAGFWHASLLDPQSYPNPEASSSGFFCHALAYGINAGLLERAVYLPGVEKAWRALVGCVGPDGRLGWVQPIGADPRKVDGTMTEVYGVGAFLLAGTEILKLSE